MDYHLTFRARGEVAEMLLLRGETPRLLVDLSVEPLADAMGLRRHTPRATFTITDPELMRRFLAEVSVGDVAEFEGSFAQGDYIPHRTTHIDTTFHLQGFRHLGRGAAPLSQRPQATPDPLTLARTATAPLLH